MANDFLKKNIKFKCQGSSNCCVSRGSYGFVYLSKKDLIRISKYLRIEINKFKKNYCAYTDGYLHLREMRKDGNCIFLKDKRCTVYKGRPMQCRTWPFWSENMNFKTWNSQIIGFCPGVGKGEKIDKRKIIYKIKSDENNEKKIIKKN